MRDEFITAIQSNQAAFGIELDTDTMQRLADYFEIVQEHNPILHLVAPSSPEEFATRHILESLTLLEFLPGNTIFADVGPGAGLPSIPCLIVRPDLKAVLIESKEKKAAFLRTVIAESGIDRRAEVIARQFSETKRPEVSVVTCRALDKFVKALPRLLKWAGKSKLLFFGGPALKEEMEKLGLKVEQKLMPLSDQRYLFIASSIRM